MKLPSARLAMLCLPLAFVLGACQPSGEEGTRRTGGSGTGISGAGASFVYPLISRWSADYNAETGHRVNYQSIGSGGGIAQIRAGTVDFGSSDAPLSSEDLAASGLGQFPSTIGGVVPVFNLDGIEPGQLRLTGPVLADVFLGSIQTWDDPAIAGLNPDLTLPSTRISIVHRSDGSGTTFNFSNYLSRVSPQWKERIGEGTALQWPTGVGGKGNEGVASYVKQIRGAIGYVELAYALQGGMPYATLRNAAGNWVEPNEDSFAAAAATADWAGSSDFDLVITNAPGDDAWPITATNFILMHKQPRNPDSTRAALAFFDWALDNGREQASALHYVPLPEALVEQIRIYWEAEFGFGQARPEE